MLYAYCTAYDANLQFSAFNLFHAQIWNFTTFLLSAIYLFCPEIFRIYLIFIFCPRQERGKMRAFFRKLRTAVFFRKLLVSYLLILVLLTGILIFLSSSLIGTISGYSQQLAYKEAIFYQTSLESNLDALDSLARELSGDQEVHTFLSCQGSIPPQLHYDLPSMIEKLNSYKFLSSYIDTIFLYLPQQELLITDSSVYSASVWNQYHLNDNSFIPLLDEFHTGTRISLSGSGRYASDIAILYTLPYGSSNGGMGTLAFIVDPMLVSSYRDASDLSSDSEVFTLDNSGDILFSSISVQELVDQYGLNPATLTPGLHTVGEYTLYAVSSDKYPLLHVAFIPTLEFARTLSDSRTVAVLCFMVLLLSGFLLSIYLANYNYRPITSIANKVVSSGSIPEESALQRIERSIDELMDIRNSSARLISQNHNLYMEGLLYKLIHGEILSDFLLTEYMNKFHLSICGPYVQMIRICAENDSIPPHLLTAFSQSSPADSFQEWYILSGRHDIKIFYFGTTASPQYEWLYDILRNYNEQLMIAFSDIHRGLTQLAFAYEETQKITDHMSFLGERGEMHYSEISHVAVSYDRNLLFEMWFKKYSNLLRDQDFDAARIIQRQIFDELKNNHYSLPFIKCKIFSFIDHTVSVLADMNEINENNLWEKYSLMDRLMDCSSIEQLESEYYSITQQLSEHLLNASPQESMVDKIIAITQKHYLDPMFSVFYVSEQLNVSNSYVSKAFKKGTGRNMLDYVQRLRIDHAKSLMSQPELTLSAIATQSGFCSDVSFIRVFKKLEGVTPGKYRSHIPS